MKRLYWRPAGPSTGDLVFLALLSVVLLVLVEKIPLEVRADAYPDKIIAARHAELARMLVSDERPRRGLLAFESTDIAQTGLIGPATSAITTSTGSLPAKRTAANPNFAALLVEYFHELDLKKGDVIAVGYSGSFPGLNIATLAAAETLELEPLIISSAASSDFGASAPSFSWLEMEHLLKERGLFRHSSFAASVGGIEDQGIGLGKAGLDILTATIEKNGAALIEPFDFADSLAHRMQLYDQAAKGRPIRAYVNVGGGTVSVGRSRGKTTYKPGVNRPGTKAPVDSIIGRFLDRGVPVIHLTKVEDLAREAGLPIDPPTRQIPGHGRIFGHRGPNPWLALGALGVLGVALFSVARRARARAHLQALPDGVVAPDSGAAHSAQSDSAQSHSAAP